MSTAAPASLRIRLGTETIGTALLVTAVIGSGIMAQRLSGGNVAIALLANTAATVAALYVLISALGPVSGAHFNPAVTAIMWLRREMSTGEAFAYTASQLVGGGLGAILAHAMFDLTLLQMASTTRAGVGQFLSECIATFWLCGTILFVRKANPAGVAAAVAACIGGAYWFTASTSFANPAVTLARSLSDTFAGIRLQDVPFFVLAQLLGAALAASAARAAKI
jgi:glycerol uptake facilitator-like aquaporin